MDSENLLKFIKRSGYCTLDTIRKEYPNTNSEAIGIALNFLVNKNKVRMVNFSLNNETRRLFYIPAGL